MQFFSGSIGTRLYLETSASPVIANFTMLDDSQLEHGQGLWCQSANNGSTIGEWFLPNGTVVSTNDSQSHPLRVCHVEGQVGLFSNSDPDLQGLYKCVIPDENEVNQTLWVAAYRDGEFNVKSPVIEGGTEYTSTSTSTDPTTFTLSFNVTTRPPTNVNCTLNGTEFSIDEKDLQRKVLNAEHPNLEVLVTVTVRNIQAGIYQCRVFTVKSGNATEPVTVKSMWNFNIIL